MDIGLFLGARVPPCTPDLLLAVARAAEERGFASLWLGEHVVLFDVHDKRYPYAASGDFPIKGEGGMAEPFTTLAFLAAATSRIRLGTGVCLVPQRNPLYTAKAVASVDWLSGGRLDFGIGIGWQHEEFEALDVSFAHRGRRTDEYVDVMRALWCDPESSFEGEFWNLAPCRAYPKPVQQPHPPIWVGGESDAALRRVVRLGGHWLPFNIEVETLVERRARLGELLEGTGRSVSDVGVIARPTPASTTPDLMDAFAEAGADQLLIPISGRLTATDAPARLDELATSYGL